LLAEVTDDAGDFAKLLAYLIFLAARIGVSTPLTSAEAAAFAT
jgi:hypothetical protein